MMVNPTSLVSGSVFRSVDELAKHLNIGRTAAYAGLRNGRIPSIRVGRKFVIPRAAIQRWLENCGRLDAA